MQKTNNRTIKTLFTAYLINLVVIMLIGFSYMEYTSNINQIISYCYYFSTTLSHFAILSIVPFLISIIVFLLFKKTKITYFLFGFLSVLNIIILKLDSLIYTQFRFHISPFVINMVFGKNASDIFHLETANIIKAVVFIIAITLIQYGILLLAKKIIAHKNNLIKPKAIAITLVICTFFSHITYAWADISFYRPITQSKEIYPLYFPLTAQSLFAKMDLIDAELIEKNQRLFKLDNTEAITYPLQTLETKTPAQKKNFLFLLIDSWRYNCLDSLVTPNLYTLSKKSQVFNNHHSGSNATADGMFTLFYGVSGLNNDNFTNHEIVPAYMHTLKKQQYDFNILGSATLENPPFNKNIFINVDNLRVNANGNTPSERDIDITHKWLAHFDKRNINQPFFDLLFFDAAHGYDHPEDYPEIFSPSLDEVDYTALDNSYPPEKILNKYKNSLHFIDQLCGKIILKLKEKNLLENTIIVVSSDHGQEFNDNKKGYWHHAGNYSKYQTQTPLFIFDFEKKPKSYQHQTLHYDVTATLMKEYLGVSNPISDFSIGTNLYNTNRKPWFLCGYKNTYAIIEEEQITKIIKNSGIFTITDKKLNTLDSADINYEVFDKALKDINKFYVKK